MMIFRVVRGCWYSPEWPIHKKYKVLMVLMVFWNLITGMYWFFGYRYYHRSAYSAVNVDSLDASLKGQVIEGLLKISNGIASNGRRSMGDTSKLSAIESYKEINKLLAKLGHDKVYPPSTKDGSVKSGVFTNPDICQEKYAYDKLSGDYPFFYKGFNIQKCTGVPPFHTILTVVYNFVYYDPKYFNDIPKIIHDVNKVYPKLAIIAAVPSSLKINHKDFNNTQIIVSTNGASEATVWNDLIHRVTTKYVYIGRNVIHFSWFDRLERLVRQINNLNAGAVASAFRTLHSGHWSNGCEQSILRNYTLVYQNGYYVSMQECLICHHVHGPFVAQTALFQKIPIESGMSTISAFASLFLSLKRSGKIVVSCPDSMAFVTDDSRMLTSKEDWKDLAHHNQIERISPSTGQIFEFDCNEANTHCSKVAGMALSICCMKELSDAVKLVLGKCKEGGMLCEVQDGTVLGSLKFNGILPWELDADLALHGHNYTAFSDKLKPYFTGLGYKWDSRPGVHQIFTANWKVELFSQNRMDTETLQLEGLSPTLINLDGVYVPTAESPGLFGRNRYGAEIYQHVLHWSQTGKVSSWDFYEVTRFPPCPTPNHHACLDQYIPDGNIMFMLPVP